MSDQILSRDADAAQRRLNAAHRIPGRPSEQLLDCERGAGRIQILIVDDEPLQIDWLSLCLHEFGYASTAASSAPEAIRFIESGQTDIRCVVTDYSMPGENGLTLAARIRSQWPGISVILCSGQLNLDVELCSVHVNALLWKPFSPTALLTAIRDALQSQDDSKRLKSHPSPSWRQPLL